MPTEREMGQRRSSDPVMLVNRLCGRHNDEARLDVKVSLDSGRWLGFLRVYPMLRFAAMFRTGVSRAFIVMTELLSAIFYYLLAQSLGRRSRHWETPAHGCPNPVASLYER